MKELIASLLKAQKEIKNALKDAKNPHLKNNYATLESVIDAVKDIANKNGLVIVQTNGRDDRGDYVETKIYHESGESIDSKCYLVLDKESMQGLGSAITYARRYTLAAMFCITQEDDDANGAKARTPAVNNKIENRTTTSLEGARVPIGKNKGKTFGEVGPKELLNLVQWLETENLKKGQAPSEQTVQFINQVKQFAGEVA